MGPHQMMSPAWYRHNIRRRQQHHWFVFCGYFFWYSFAVSRQILSLRLASIWIRTRNFCSALVIFLLAIGLADIRMIHDEAAALFQDFEPAVIGAADRNAVVAGRRLDPDIVEAGLARDPAVGHAVQATPPAMQRFWRRSSRAASGRGPAARFRCRPGPARPGPPNAASRGFFPISAAVLDVGLVEFGGPVRHIQLAVAVISSSG